MNNERRKRLSNCIRKFKVIVDELNDIISDEEFAFDSIPENLQSSMRAEEAEENIEIMNDASSAIGDALIDLEDIL